MRSRLAAVLVVFTLPSAAQTLDPADFERVLLPISFTGEIGGLRNAQAFESSSPEVFESSSLRVFKGQRLVPRR